MNSSVTYTPQMPEISSAPSILVRQAQPLPGGTPTFDNFRRLPAEIRLLIWTLMLPGPRLVLLREEECGTSKARLRELDKDPDNQFISSDVGRPGIAGPFMWCFRSTCPVPILLHICHESRAFASKYYKKCFGHPDRSEPLTYFRWDQDILYVENCFTDTRTILTGKERNFELEGLYFEGLAEVKYLALGIGISQGTKLTSFLINDILMRFGTIMTVYVLADYTDYDDDHSHVVLLPPQDVNTSLDHYSGCWHYSPALPASQTYLDPDVIMQGVANHWWQVLVQLGTDPKPDGGMSKVCFGAVATAEAAGEMLRAKERFLHGMQSEGKVFDQFSVCCGACKEMGYTELGEGECLFQADGVEERCVCGRAYTR